MEGRLTNGAMSAWIEDAFAGASVEGVEEARTAEVSAMIQGVGAVRAGNLT